MRTDILKYAAALILGFVTLMSCEPTTAEVEPVFPSTVMNKTVAPGESVQISIDPNMAWEVSIEGEGAMNFFWLDDAGMKATKVSGKSAGPAVVTVVFSDDEEFDVNRVCDVYLTMKGQEKKIATITRPSLGRSMEFYAGVAADDGFTEEFDTAKISKADLLTFSGLTTYTLPVRVVSNYAWDIALPSWLKAYTLDGKNVVTSGNPGTVDIILSAVLDENVQNGAEGVVKFIDSSNDAAEYSLEVNLPAFADRVEVEMNSMEFNIAGEVLMPNGSYVEGTAVAYVLAVQGAVVKALEWKGDTHDTTAFAEWVTVECGEYDEEQGILQIVDFSIGVTENPGEKRYADLFVFPASMSDVTAEDICDESDPECGFKEEYVKYHVGRLVQAGDVAPYIVPISSEELRSEVGTYFSTLDPKDEDNVLQWDFASAPIYQKIVYTGEYSADEGSFDCAEPFASVKLFADTDYPMGMFSQEITEADECWISFATFGGENKKGRFNMNFVPESATHTAAVFYDESDNILAAVLVAYDPSFTGNDSAMQFSISSGRGVIEKMDKNSDLYMAINGNYSVTEVYQITTDDEKMVYVEGSAEIWGMLTVSSEDFSDYKGSISIDASSPNFYIYTSGCKERDEVILILQVMGADGESMVNHSAIHIIYDPEASLDLPAPFSFVYPDYVGGMATLEKCTGEWAETVIADWHIPSYNIYLLTYNDPSAASIAIVNVPGAPLGDSAMNGYDPNTNQLIEDYWLTHEMNGKQMTVYMSETGKNDYFVFTDASGNPSYALVCTMELPE